MAVTEEIEATTSFPLYPSDTSKSTFGFDSSIFDCRTYGSVEEAHDSMAEHAASCGFALRKRRDNKSKKKGRIAGVTKVVYVCACEGIYKNSRPELTDETRKRQCVSKRTGCKWEALVKLREEDKRWVIIFKNIHHNHFAFDDIRLFSTSRRLPLEAKQTVETLAQSRIKAAWQAIRAVETCHPKGKNLKRCTDKKTIAHAQKMAPYMVTGFECKKTNSGYGNLEEVQAPILKRQKLMRKSIQKHGNRPEECSAQMLCSDILQDTPDFPQNIKSTEMAASLADLDSDHMHSELMNTHINMPANNVHDILHAVSPQQEIDQNLTVSNSDAISEVQASIQNADVHTVVRAGNGEANFSEEPPSLTTTRIEIGNICRRCFCHSDVGSRGIYACCFQVENIMQMVSEAELRFDDAWNNFYGKVHHLFSQDVAQILLNLGEMLKSEDDNAIIQSAMQIKSAHQVAVQQIQKLCSLIKILQIDLFEESNATFSHQIQVWEKQLKDLILDKFAILSQTTMDIVSENSFMRAQMLSLLEIEQRILKEESHDGHIFADPLEFQKCHIQHEASLKKIMDNFLKSLIDALHKSISDVHSIIKSPEEEVLRKKVQVLENYNSELKAQCETNTRNYNNLQTQYNGLNQKFLELQQSKEVEEKMLKTKIQKLEAGLLNLKRSLLHTVIQNSDFEIDSNR